MKQPILVRGKVRLKDFDPGYCDHTDKEEIREKTMALGQRIGELQQLLYANTQRAILILFQGMDASGKDGAVRRVLEYVNPAGVQTANFKRPSDEERAHDYLWRVHKAIPRYGYIGVFNRSHYEDVLIVRVLGLQPKRVWEARYAQINAFEKFLSENGIALCKFFLHLSKEEQAERLKARLSDPTKNWKFSTEDLKMRTYWPQFQQAFEDMLNRCSTDYAPWHVVPADRKWYRDYVVARAVAKTLEAMNLKWPKPVEDLSKIKIT